MSQTLRGKLIGLADISSAELRLVRTLLNGNQDTLDKLETLEKENLVEALNEVLQLAKAQASPEAIEIAVNDYFVLHPDSFTYEQSTPASSWLITHPLDHQPSVMVLDSAGTIWRGQVSYPSRNQVLIQFNLPLAGKAVLT